MSATAQTAKPPFKGATNEFEEEGLSIIDLEDLEAQEKPLDEPEPAPAEPSEKKKRRVVPKKGPSEWALSEEWFLTPPQTIENKVGRKDQYRLGKGMDLRKGYKAWIDGKRIKHARITSKPKTPIPGQVFYNFESGILTFPTGSAGQSFKVEYHLRGKKPIDEKGKAIHVEQNEDEEYKSVQGLKKRSHNLWTNILNHPDPEFVRDHLIPIIEDELEHLRADPKKALDVAQARLKGADDKKTVQKAIDKAEKNLAAIPNITNAMMTLEHLLHRLDDEDAVYTKDEESFTLDDTFHEMDAGSQLRSISFQDSGEKLTATEDDPAPGEFVLDEDVLLFNEEDLGRPITLVINKPSDTKEKVVQHIKNEISPKLEAFHALASLLADQVYSMHTEAADEDLDGLPGMGKGARTLDLQFLRYVHSVRGESNKIEKDLTYFAKFHMPRLAQIIQSGKSYYPGEKAKKWSKSKSDYVWKETVKPTFEKAGVGISDLLGVALDAFRQGVLEFDYERRPSEVRDPKQFRIQANPRLWRLVTTALHNKFTEHREDLKQEGELTGQHEIVIPRGGGEVSFEKKISPPSVKIVSLDTGKAFVEGGGLRYVASPARGKTSGFNLKKGTLANGQPSPFGGKKFIGLKNKSGKTPTTLSLKDSEGNQFKRVEDTGGSAVPRVIKESSDRIFYFAHSSGIVWLPKNFEGEVFLVNVGGVSGIKSGDALLGKNEYAVKGTPGIIEFSPANGGEKVSVSYNRTIRTTRMVTPQMRGTGDEDVEGEQITAPAVEFMPGEGLSPEEQLGLRITEKNVERILDHIEGVLYDPDEKRLSDEEKALLIGIFGIGLPNNQRLSIREIAQDEPFNIDVSTKSGGEAVSRLRKVMQPQARKTLSKILREKIGKDEGLQQIMKSRAFNRVLFEGEKPTDKDKVLKYILLKRKEGDADPTKNLRTFLDALLVKSGGALSEDEENILRWSWSLPGMLRDDDPDKERDELSAMGGPPLSLPEIAKIEFGLDPDDEKAVAIVEKVYERGLEKFEKIIDHALQRVGEKLKTFPWAVDFMKFYKQQRDRETFRDLILEDEKVSLPPPPEKKKLPRISLFDEIRQSARVEDESILLDMLSELDEAQKRGKDLSTLIREREELLDKASVTDRKKLFNEVEELHKGFLDASKQHGEIHRDTEALSSERKDLLHQIRDNADEELTKQIAEAGAAHRAASGNERKATQKALMALLQKARAAAPAKLQKAWKENANNLSKSRGELKEWFSLIKKQREAIDKAHKNPLLKAKLELSQLGHIQSFFVEHDERGLGRGKYNLKNLFESKEPADLKRRVEEWAPKVREKGIGAIEMEERRKKEEGAWVEERDRLRKERAEIKRLEEETRVKGLSPEERAKIRLEVQRRKDEASVKFTPREREISPDRERNLYDQLLSVALPPNPDHFTRAPGNTKESQELAKERVEEVAKFRTVMDRMRKFVVSGEGTVEDFINDPKTSKNELLIDEENVLGRVKQFLTDHAQDIQTEDGSWDLSKLFARRKYEPSKEEVAPEPDLIPLGEKAEALQNAQRLAENEARVLHALITMVTRGTPLERIKRGLQKSRSLEAGSAAALLERLQIWKKLHPEAKNFSTLYSGEHQFPTRETGEKRKPLQWQMQPLVDSIQKEKESDDSPAQTNTKLLDMLTRMGELAEQGFGLDEMMDHLIELDAAQEAPYSLAYLFQKVRNYLHRLNRTKGLQNMVSNLGLDAVFPQGAPLESPADAEETTPALPAGEEPKVDEDPAGFRQLVKEQQLTDDEAAKAMQILQSTQLRMEDNGTPAAEILRPFIGREGLAETVKKIFFYLRDHISEIKSKHPGIPDLSSLTGLPFRPPDVSEDEAAAQAVEEPAVEEPAVEEPPRRNRIKWLVGQLKKDSPGRRKTRIQSLIDMAAFDPRELYTAIMNAGLPPSESLKLRSLFEHEEEGMGAMMPEPKDHGMIEETVRGEEEIPPQAPKAPPKAKAKRGRLPKTLATMQLDEAAVRSILSTANPTSDEWPLLDKYLPGWEKASSYNELVAIGKKGANKIKNAEGSRTIKKAWNRIVAAWREHLRSLPVPEAVPAPEAALSPQVDRGKLLAALKTLSVPDLSAVQQALRDQAKAMPKTLDQWHKLQSRLKSPAVDKLIAAIDRLVQPPAPAPAPAPAVPPAPAPAAPPPIDLERLKTLAVQNAQAKNWNADQFGQHLQEKRPDLMEAYESIKPAVQKALEEIASKFEVDLSDL